MKRHTNKTNSKVANAFLYTNKGNFFLSIFIGYVKANIVATDIKHTYAMYTTQTNERICAKITCVIFFLYFKYISNGN